MRELEFVIPKEIGESSSYLMSSYSNSEIWRFSFNLEAEFVNKRVA